MSHHRKKLWVGIGTCMLLGSAGTQADDAPAPETHASTSMLVASAGGEGGEAGHGGEGGEAGHGGEGGEAGRRGW